MIPTSHLRIFIGGGWPPYDWIFEYPTLEGFCAVLPAAVGEGHVAGLHPEADTGSHLNVAPPHPGAVRVRPGVYLQPGESWGEVRERECGREWERESEREEGQEGDG